MCVCACMCERVSARACARAVRVRARYVCVLTSASLRALRALLCVNACVFVRTAHTYAQSHVCVCERACVLCTGACFVFVVCLCVCEGARDHWCVSACARAGVALRLVELRVCIVPLHT